MADDKSEQTDDDRRRDNNPAQDSGGDGDKGNGGDDDSDDEETPSPLHNPKVKWGLIIAGVIVLIVAILWFVHYWTRGRYEQATNDAYVQADIVTIAPKVAGYVQQVLVDDNQQVRAGQPLAVIDPRDSRAKLEQAQAQVDQGRATIVEDEAQIDKQRAMIEQARAQLRGAQRSAYYAQREADRYGPLAAQGAHSQEQLDQMLQQRDQSVSEAEADRAQLLSAERQITVLKAQIGSAKAQIEQAEAQVRQAQTDVQSTMVRSSIDGRIGDRQVRVGQYVQTGTKLMSVVPVDRLYIVANFKETQVGLMRIGQPATIIVDAIGGDELHGRVESFSPGTGSQFAILPPQNATGNFTKVVQRVPVRIAIEAGPEARKVLVPGLSVEVTVDTIGAKEDRHRFKEEARRTEDRAAQEHKAAIERDRAADRPGSGQ
ncbi:HlyD family secretion protein [Sphingomonas oryzagri]